MELLKEKTGKVLSISHRGVINGSKENSLESIKLSISSGVDGVELDVQQTKDRKLVLFHNKQISFKGKMTCINSLTWEQLRSIDLAGEKIPLLEDALQITKESDLLIVLDLKSIPFFEDLIKVVRDYQKPQNIILASFNLCYLNKIKVALPEIITVLTIGFSRSAETLSGLAFTVLGLLYPIKIARYIRASAILCSEKRLSNAIVSKAHHVEIPIFLWIKGDCANLRYYIDMNVDGILSHCANHISYR